MQKKLLYQVDDIQYEIIEKPTRKLKLMVWGKASSTGWSDIDLVQKEREEVQEKLRFDLMGVPPQNHEGIHDDTMPVLTDVYVEEEADLSELTEPIFSISVHTAQNTLEKSLTDM